MNRLKTSSDTRDLTRLGNRFARVAVVLLAVVVGPSARAAELTPQQKLEMKQLYERATRAYDVGKYNEAIEEYQKAYEIGGDPPMLYNIAQAYRLNDQPNEALRFYRRYLQRAPNARNREDVERKIAELDKIAEERRKTAAAAAPAPVTPPPPAPSAGPGTRPSPPPVPAAPPPGTGSTPGGATPAVPADEGPSQARTIVSWSLVGAGVLCGAGAVVAGLIARGKSNDITSMSAQNPPVTFNPDIEHSGKVANQLMIGLGIAGGALAVTGVILVLTGGSSSSAEAPPAQESTPVSVPTAMVAPWLGGGVVGAGAGFRF